MHDGRAIEPRSARAVERGAARPLVSALVPTHGRPDRLAALLDRLASQVIPAALVAGRPGIAARLEVVVGFDGPDPRTADRARAAWVDAGGPPDDLRVVACPRRGYIHVRHALLPELGGLLYLSLNDDVLPEPGFVAAHADVQLRALDAGAPVVTAGDAPFLRAGDDATVIDRLVEDTDLVFFRSSTQRAAERHGPDHDHGFRHAFGLNVCAPLDEVLAAGGVPSLPFTYGYDDVELAWRLARRGLPVRFVPGARAPHDHRHSADDVLRREVMLGRAAVRWARRSPTCLREILGRDLLDADTVCAERRAVADGGHDADRSERAFRDLGRIPASAVDALDADARARLLESLRLQCVPARRWLFRRGLLAELDGEDDPVREPGAPLVAAWLGGRDRGVVVAAARARRRTPAVRVGAVVLARMDSTRFPGKVLADLAGRRILDRVLDAMEAVAGLDGVVVATTAREVDAPVRDAARVRGVAVHAGDLHDVAGRLVAAARGAGFDVVVRVNADSPFPSPSLLEEAIGIVRTAVAIEGRPPDLVANVADGVAPRSWPYGVACELCRVDALADRLAREASPAVREHPTLVLRAPAAAGPPLDVRPLVRRGASLAHARLTVDEPADLARLAALVRRAADRLDVDPAGVIEPIDLLAAAPTGVVEDKAARLPHEEPAR